MGPKIRKNLTRRCRRQKLIYEINSLPDTDIDILGSAYEEVIQDIMTGKVLGQFFTQPLVKKMMVKLIEF